MNYADQIRVEPNAHNMRDLIASGIEENKNIADSAVSTANAKGDTAINTANQAVAQTNANKNQIANIIAGSGTSNTETVDIRAAADGKVYTTAGEHVRQLDSDMADIVQQDLPQKADKIYVDTKFGSMGNTKTFKGSCSFTNLPTSGMTVDDYWYVTDQNTNRCWSGTSWADIGNNVSLGDGAVTPQKTNFIKPGNNLFDYTEIISGYYLNNGVVTINASQDWKVTGFIPVIAGEKYHCNTSCTYWAFYDSNHSIISYNAGKTAIKSYEDEEYIVPTNAVYIRMSATFGINNFKSVDAIMFNHGDSLLPFETFGLYLNRQKSESIDGDSVIRHSLNIDRLNFYKLGNLYDKNNIIIDKIINTTDGVFIESQSGSAYTNYYIDVIGNESYYLSDAGFVYAYDSNKNFIRSWSSVSGAITMPSNAVYCRLAFQNNTYSNNIMFAKSSKAVEFKNAQIIPKEYLEQENINIDTWYDKKKMTTQGDSITANNMYQPYLSSKLGVIVTNIGIGGTTIGGSSDTAMWQDVRVNAIPADTEVLYFMGGSNDWAQNIPIGTINDTDNSTFIGAFKIMLQKIYARIPNARVFLGIQPFRANMVANTNGNVLQDYRNATELIAKAYGYPLVDTLQAGINQLNYTSFMKTDTNEASGYSPVHQNELGGQRLAECIIGKMKELEPLN